jgi:DNA replication factor GINS
MDLDQLQSVRDRERGTDDLQELRESFYEDATAFVRELRAERSAAAEAVDEPFDSPKVNRLTDRIRTAEQTLEAIYEKRVGKVVKAATFAAADLPAEADGMTAEEAELFETLVAEIRENREQVLGGVADAADELDEAAEMAQSESAMDAAEIMGSGNEESAQSDGDMPDGDPPDGAPPDEAPPAPEDAPEPPEPDPPETAEEDTGDERGTATDGEKPDRPDVDRERVRITDDVGAILGVDDREYDLAAGEVVTLPSANVEPLVEQGVAERLE